LISKLAKCFRKIIYIKKNQNAESVLLSVNILFNFSYTSLNIYIPLNHMKLHYGVTDTILTYETRHLVTLTTCLEPRLTMPRLIRP
jgi:hypothetical protein